MDQFRDFQTFVRKIDKHGMKSGIVKIVPPQEWYGQLFLCLNTSNDVQERFPLGP